MTNQTEKLTDSQCDEFRRLPMSFNDMVRAIYKAGQDALAEQSMINGLTEAETNETMSVKGLSKQPAHDSDCAVHNAPAYPVGECNCSVVDKKQWVGLSDWDYVEIYGHANLVDWRVVRAIEAKLRENNNG